MQRGTSIPINSYFSYLYESVNSVTIAQMSTKKPREEITPEFAGTMTVGERGQVVIPIDVRKSLSLEKGERLLVFRVGEVMISARLESLEHIATKMTSHKPEKAAFIRSLIKTITQ